MKNIKNCIVYLTLFALSMVISSCSPPADTSQADSNTEAVFDPVSMDPRVADSEYAPTFEGWSFEVEGSLVNAQWWQPEGKGPNPTILLLHGYPGNEKNLDLARVLQRAGFNVMFFHYRGTWGSAGHFTFSNALEDIAAAVAEVRTCFGEPECEYPVDANKIALFGHSMGGWLGMLSAIEIPGISCAAILDFGMAFWASEADQHVAEHGEVPPWLKENEEYWMTEGRPLRIEGEGSFSADLLANIERFGPIERATELARQNLFILSTTDNEKHPIVVQALEEQGAKQLRAETWESDHSFNDRRIELAYAMVDYYSNSCFN
jgi:pimeloyl-ACP methyl ester carboxylesterase